MHVRLSTLRISTRALWLAALMVLGLVALAGCGSDDPTAVPAAPAATATSAPTATLAPGATPHPTMVFKPAATAVPSRDFTSVWEGKTVVVSVGYSPGGGADAMARMLAIHLPKFLPGNPRVVVVNRPGGGTSLNARDMLRRPTDGTYIGQFAQGLMVKGVMGQGEDWFKWDDYNYLGMVDGAQEKTISVVCGRTDKMKNLDEFLNGGPWKWGDISPDTSAGVTMGWFNVIDFPADIYFGFGGSAEVAAAFDRGEMDISSRCNPTYAKTYPDWWTENKVIPLFGWGNLDPDSQIPPDQGLAEGIRDGRWPWFGDMHETLANNATAEQFAALDAYVALGGTHVWALPPGVPADIVEVVENAFWETVNSAGYLEDMTIRERLVAPLSGADTRARIQTMQDLPPSGQAVLEAMTGGG
jgi:tripartite-type tricarboxylate transporter receptor subunit TctC